MLARCIAPTSTSSCFVAVLGHAASNMLAQFIQGWRQLLKSEGAEIFPMASWPTNWKSRLACLLDMMLDITAVLEL